jgi:hypothetical protein
MDLPAMGHGPAVHAAIGRGGKGLKRIVRAWRNGSRNGLKIRRKKFRGGSSPPARTNPLLVRLLTDEGQERSTSIAHGKVVATSLRATPLPSGGVGGASDQQR